MTELGIVGIVFLAAVLQSLSGFGFAVLVMPLITLILDLRTAAPLVAMAGLTAYTINLVRYRQSLEFREVLRLGIASACGVPVGLWVLVHVEESLVNRGLGAILAAYAVYNLVRPTTSRLISPGWGYLAGWLAGCLGGAYNTPGPPVILYGSLRQWPRDQFRAILQTFFFFNGMLVVASHLLARHVTPTVLTRYLVVAPALVLGLWVGSRLDRKVRPKQFRFLVTVMILMIGLTLMIGVG